MGHWAHNGQTVDLCFKLEAATVQMHGLSFCFRCCCCSLPPFPTSHTSQIVPPNFERTTIIPIDFLDFLLFSQQRCFRQRPLFRCRLPQTHGTILTYCKRACDCVCAQSCHSCAKATCRRTTKKHNKEAQITGQDAKAKTQNKHVSLSFHFSSSSFIVSSSKGSDSSASLNRLRRHFHVMIQSAKYGVD